MKTPEIVLTSAIFGLGLVISLILYTLQHRPQSPAIQVSPTATPSSIMTTTPTLIPTAISTLPPVATQKIIPTNIPTRFPQFRPREDD